MWGDVNSILGLGKELPHGHFFLLTNDDKSEIGFLVNSILHFYLKKQGKVVFVHVVQDFTHYQTIASKCGVNLKAYCNTGTLLCIDGLGLMKEALETRIAHINSGNGNQDSDAKNVDPENPFNFVVGGNNNGSNNKHCLRQLFLKIKDMASTLQSDDSQNILLLFDDITCLLGLGATVTEVYDLVHYCYVWCLQCRSATSAAKGTLAVLAQEGGDIDTEYERLVRALKRFSTVHIKTQGLSMGYSKDVHGEITFHKANFGIGPPEVTTMHYKVTSRGAKFFARGMGVGLT